MNRNLAFCERLFSERAIETAVKLGTEQCLFFAARHNMFAYRRPYWANGLRVFELSSRYEILDKLIQLEQNQTYIPANTYYIEWDTYSDGWKTRLCGCYAFDAQSVSFCDLMSMTWNLSKDDFARILVDLNDLIPYGSSVVFDYRENSDDVFRDGYSYRELEQLLSKCGYHIYEHVSASEMKELYLRTYNLLNCEQIVPPSHVNYCLAVKK